MNNTAIALFLPGRRLVAFEQPNEGGTGGGGGQGAGGNTGDGNGGSGGAQTATTSNQPPAGEPPAKQGDGASGESGDAGQPEGQQNQLPEAYEWRLPEGVQIGEGETETYQSLFRELSLTQEQVDRIAEVEGELAQARIQQQEQMREDWKAAAQKDEELGRDWDLTLQRAGYALNELADEEFANFLEDTGLGDHPVLIKAFARLGQVMSNDQFGSGNPAPEQQPSYRSWYQNTTPESKKG